MRVSLNGLWKATVDLGVQSKAGKPGYDPQGWKSVPVPGHWQQAPGLEKHTGRLLYRHTFSWERSLGESELARLRFEGVFYDAKVWINGTFLGEHRGYFVPASYDVTKHLRPGENVVMVEVDAPHEEDRNNKQMIAGVFGHWDCKSPDAEPGGIWRDVFLEIHHGVMVDQLTLRALPDLGEGPITATVDFDLGLTSVGEGHLTWTATLTPETFAGEPIAIAGVQTVRRGWNRLQGAMSVLEPRLWWTWDHGQPDLYRFTVELSHDGGPAQRIERLVGIRKVELRQWHLYLNGRRIFMRGTNYGPPDIRIANVPADGYRRDLALMREANMNMLRVYAHIDKPALYEEASRQGLLVWQDFPLQWLYSRSILAEAKRQAKAMVDELGHWPAIGLWCCHNEPHRYGDRIDPSLLDRSRTYLSTVAGNWNKSTLDPALRDVIRSADPTRPCLAHAGEGGADTHHYWGWYSGQIQDLKKVLKSSPDSARFVTEFGAQSFPSPANSRKIVRGEWPNLNWADLRDRYLLQTKVMERNVPHTLAKTFEEYVQATQEHQALQHKYFIEHFRRLKYRPCGGILQFLFTDSSPGVTCSIVDYWREPKAAYQAVRGAFQPLYILADWPDRSYSVGTRVTLQVLLINDRYQNYKGVWRWSIEREGQTLATQSQPAYLPPDGLVTAPGGLDWIIPNEVEPGPVDLVFQLDLEGVAPVENRYRLVISPIQSK